MTETPPGALPTPYVPGMSGLSVMARGGYATVYRATQDSVGRDVAIKVENRTLENPRDQARFLREAKAAGRMSSHPHVVDLFDVGVTVDQHPYLIMELCDGSYLDRMRVSPLTAVETRDLGVKIADALVHSHANGVLHRDVKPANILYSHFNPAVLADFGLAVLGEMRDSSVTLEVLTPAYAPPEMFRHDQPSGAVDVYALCATLYAVMRGHPPRWDTERSPSLITLMELFDRPIPDLPNVPPALTEVLRYGMANDPRARPTAEQLRELLTGLQLGRSTLPAPPAVYRSSSFQPPPSTFPQPRPIPPVSQTQADETPTVHTQGRKRGKRKWFLGGFGVFLLFTASMGGAWLAGANRGNVRSIAGKLRVPVASSSPINWKVFATGILPAGIDPADREAVTGDETVRRVCSVRSFRRATSITDTDGYAFSVLPSMGEDRTFQCLAAHSGPAHSGPAHSGPAHSGPAHSGPAHSGSRTASSSPVSTSAPG